MDGDLVGAQLGLRALSPGRVRCAKMLDPGAILLSVDAPPALLDELLEHHPGIADDAHVHGPVVPQLRAVDVHLDELGVLIEPRRPEVEQHRVGPRPHGEDDIGLAEGGAAGAAEEETMVLRNDPLAPEGSCRREYPSPPQAPGAPPRPRTTGCRCR